MIKKLQLHVANHGTKAQQRRALDILLPSNSLYEFLEGRVPYPSETYSKIADSLEAEEKAQINEEIAKRRSRLGARIEQVRRDVRREVLGNSTLEDVYKESINWTRDDSQRREFEEKLLSHAYETLKVLPDDKKEVKRVQVQELARGMVIIKHPFKLAWTIELEWKDCPSLDCYDITLLMEYMDFFPGDGVAHVLRAYVDSEISPFTGASDGEAVSPQKNRTASGQESEETAVMSPEDRLVMMMDGLNDSPQSLLAHRVTIEYYHHLQEFEVAVETARKAQRILEGLAQDTGLRFENSLEAMNVLLATSLIFYSPPRYFDEAESLFDGLLERNSRLTPGLVGKGQLLGAQGDYAAALELLEAALKYDPEVLSVRLEVSWYRALCGDYKTALEGLEGCFPRIKGTDSRSRRLKAETIHRIGVCLWNLDESSAARKNRKGAYARFLGALQADANYAPAYTSLGLYYADYSRDKRRARKCFLKAIELSSAEILAAEYLARGYADVGDWDLVELAAQRAIESGKTRPSPGSKNRGFSWPHAALGIVQLNRQEYAKSIVSYQQALKVSPDDYHSWIGLGECYHNSGRYIAATKAFEQAQKVQRESDQGHADDVWFAKLLSANVKREIGEYEPAVEQYSAVLAERPGDFGVSIALVQTLVEGAWRCIETGFFCRATEYARRVIDVCTALAQDRSAAFNLWKAFGDGCALFSFVHRHLDQFPASEVKALLGANGDAVGFNNLSQLDAVGWHDLTEEHPETDHPETLRRCLHSAILAHKRSVHASRFDVHARAVAWYNLGWTEYRAHVCLSPPAEGPSSKRSSGYLKAAVQCFKRAIEAEARNGEFWNALGVVTCAISPKISQHSLVRSLFLNDRNAQVWTNLGALYLLNDDLELANEAFSRAQATDPEYAQAWLGQGLLARLMGQEEQSRGLITHAFEISGASVPLARSQFALTVFDGFLARRGSQHSISLIHSLFALHQLRPQSRAEPAIEHLSALFSERARDYSAATRHLVAVCDAAEQDYEVSESVASLTRFAQGKADLARVLLAAGDYKAAVESAETTLQLSATDEADGGATITDPEAGRRCRLSAHVTAGLAHYYNQGVESMDEALEMFRAALEETKEPADVVCLLAQLLSAKSGRPQRASAIQTLLDTIAEGPSHIHSTILLGVIALVADDHDALDAAIVELESLRANPAVSDEDLRRIQDVLTVIASLYTSASSDESNSASARATAEARIAVMQHPFHPHGWSQLASLSSDDAYLAQMALKTAQRAVPPQGSLSPETLARTYAASNRLNDMQSAIIVAPWLVDGWSGLSEMISG